MVANGGGHRLRMVKINGVERDIDGAGHDVSFRGAATPVQASRPCFRLGWGRIRRQATEKRPRAHRQALARSAPACAATASARRDALQAAEADIGRASCRERGCQYVWISVVAVPVKNKKK